jgi:hypothetical protein
VVHHDDVYLVSFPRSGNTWLRYLLTALLRGPVVDAALVDLTIPDIHRSDPACRPGSGPIWVKSHTPASEGPTGCRVIYLVRHGLHAMLSYHQYLQARGRLAPGVDVRTFLMTEVWPCRWDAHVEGWLDEVDRRGADGALLVHYERLLSHTALELKRVAAFLHLDASPEQIGDAVSSAQRRQMMKEERRSGHGTLNIVGHAEPRPFDDLGSGWISTNSEALERAGYET